MRKKLLASIIIIVLLLVVIIPMAIGLGADWLWFSAQGFTTIFSTILLTKLFLGIITGLVTFSIIYLNFYIAYRRTKDQPIVLNNLQFQGRSFDVSKIILKLLLPVSLAIGLMTGTIGSSYWQVVQQFINRVSFNTVDPLFGRDISFYFFTLPFIKMAIGFLFWIIIISILGAGLQYLARGLMNIRGRRIQTAGAAKNHLAVLLAIFFIILASSVYFTSMTNLLYSNTGPFTGANYTDIFARLPVLWALVSIALFIAAAFIISTFKPMKRLVPSLIIFYIAVSILGGSVYSSIIQRLVVLPNELIKETPYIERNIAATRVSFGLDKVIKRELVADETSLTSEDIKNNELTIKNIRLWDRKPLLDTFGQIQEIRTYYDFVSIDNDRYTIDGEYRQTMLSPRELNTANLPAATFINERLVFTHGFGVALGPVNEVTKEGLPLLFVKDLPPVSSTESIKVTRPEIYFGELSSDYVFVNTQAEEFNYPSGDENVFTTYEGTGGVAIDSFMKKALFAADLGSLKILLSNDINNDSRVLLNRNITKRVKKIMPFLKYDSDPYMVITDEGQLKWIYDAYTTSDAYPYANSVLAANTDTNVTPATSVRRINYIRNSVKVVIDAYSGAMKFYIADEQDPVIQTYAKIFPDTFVALDTMPDDLQTHIRYPEDIFKYQTFIYSTYHMEEAQIFYNKEDKWEVPRISSERDDPMMRHMIMKLPAEEKEEFILMLPYTPRNKDNLAAWMVARSDGDNYGELVVYRFPKQTLIFGPKQIVNRINQDADISQQISLWDQRGSEVIRGNLLVIPIEESLIYVQPLYLRAEGGKIPELKRVIVAYKNQIAMGETLDEALNAIFSGAIAATPEEPADTDAEPPVVATTPEDLVSQANTHYQAALNAQKRGDWAAYGREIEALGNVLNQLK
ncbi:UPF0182 family protein [Patescibacteria group bacterium]|nr:UPF0182 family protein [Patescibacteria group bacterium]